MIKYTTGNILTSDNEAITNTVNTYGVMGKGIALAFKKSFPENYKYYREKYDNGELSIGKMVVFETGLLTPKFIINFPTKKHWRNRSKIEYIKNGLVDLKKVIQQNNIKSIAIPPLGCGNGGLNWKEVRDLISNELEEISREVDIVLFEPGFNLNIRSVKSINSLNPTRAIYFSILRQYELLGEEITTVVVQKLAYLLQRIGEKLNLRFDKGIYGPYSPNLNKMLEALSPNYISYDGELNSPSTVIKLVQEKKAEALEIAENKLTTEQKDRLNSIQQLIAGFENSFGLELLATVAYAVENCPQCTKSEIIKDIQNWTYRKKKLMSDHMISVSYDRIKEFSL